MCVGNSRICDFAVLVMFVKNYYDVCTLTCKCCAFALVIMLSSITMTWRLFTCEFCPSILKRKVHNNLPMGKTFIT